MIKRGPCFIISLSAIMGCWNISFVFLIVDSMICNPNIYFRGTKGKNKKLPPSSPYKSNWSRVTPGEISVYK